MANACIVDCSIFLRSNQHQSVLFFKSAIASCSAHATFECKCAVCNLPAVVHSTYNVVFRTTRVGEKHFTKLGCAVGLNNAAHFNALLTHRHQQVRNTCVLGCCLVGAGEKEAIVGVVSLRSPHLLTVDYPLVTVEHCGGFEAGQVASAIWLAESLTPAHLAAENLWKKLFLLLFSSPLQQRWADKCVAEEVGAHRCFCVCKLFCQHDTLQCVEAFAAVFLWPRCADPAAFKQFAWPLCVELFALISGEFKTFVEPALRQIGDKPRFHFFTEGFGLGCVCQHPSILPRGARFSPYEGHTGETKP